MAEHFLYPASFRGSPKHSFAVRAKKHAPGMFSKRPHSSQALIRKFHIQSSACSRSFVFCMLGDCFGHQLADIAETAIKLLCGRFSLLRNRPNPSYKYPSFLFYRNGFREVARAIDIKATEKRRFIRQKLREYHRHKGCKYSVKLWNKENSV